MTKIKVNNLKELLIRENGRDSEKDFPFPSF